MATDVEQLNEPSGEAGSSGKHRSTISVSYSRNLHDSGTHSAEYCVNSRDFADCILWLLAGLDLKSSVLSGSRCQRCIYRGIEGEGQWLSHTAQPYESQNIPGLIKYLQVCPFNEIRTTDRAMSLLRGRHC